MACDPREKTLKRIEIGSGNVFADLAVPESEECLAKAKLVQRIADVIAERKLTQARAAAILGGSTKVQPVRGKFEGFSIDRLLRFLKRAWARCGDRHKPRPTQQRPASTSIALR